MVGLPWMVWGLSAQAADLRELELLLQQSVTPQGVDYRVLRAERSTLEEAAASLESVALEGLSLSEKKALWINAYNLLTLLVIVQAPEELSSIRDLDGGEVWSSRSFVVAGERVTLDDLEHRRLRPLGDPRIHAAVNCASRGCPPLAPELFRSESLDQQLSEATQTWLNTNAFDLSEATGVLRLSKIFEWYGEDFTAPAPWESGLSDPRYEGPLYFLLTHLSPERAAALQTISGVELMSYDWSLNQHP